MMMRYIKEGWSAALQQRFALLTLMTYRFAWAFVLYALIRSVVLPLLHRYPGSINAAQSHLFAAEGEFRLFKTDIGDSYVWLLGGLLLTRMLLTPLLNAGLYYSLSNTHLNAGYRFVQGVRELGKPFFAYYVLQTILSLAPLAYVLPKATVLLRTGASFSAIAASLLPYAAALLAWGYAVRLLFMYIQFGRTDRQPLLRTLGACCRSFFRVLGVSLLLLALSLLLSAATMSATYLWAGLWTMIAYQAYRFVHTFFGMWEITAQHRLFQDKMS